MKKKYVYITKECGILFPHVVVSDNREKVKNEFGVCIDNIYDYNMILRVRDWYYRLYGIKMVVSELYGIYFIDFEKKEYVKNFSQFSGIVNEYRNRE